MNTELIWAQGDGGWEVEGASRCTLEPQKGRIHLHDKPTVGMNPLLGSACAARLQVPLFCAVHLGPSAHTQQWGLAWPAAPVKAQRLWPPPHVCVSRAFVTFGYPSSLYK